MNNDDCGPSHPDLMMEMLRSNSDSSLAAPTKMNLHSEQKNLLNQSKCLMNVSTQTDLLNGLESLLIPSTIEFPGWNYDQLPPPPSPSEPTLNDESSLLIDKNDQQKLESVSTISREAFQGINQILLAHALGQLTDEEDSQEDDEDELDEDDYEDDEDDILEECDAIEYADVSLTRSSPNHSLGLCLSSDHPLALNENEQNHQYQKAQYSQGNANSLSSSSSFDHNQGNGHRVEEESQQSKVAEQNDNNESSNIRRSEVYISLLEPGGLAERSGLIKIGDQILEINGSEVANLDEAKSILSRREISSFSLLIGRPNINHDHSKCCERSLAKRLALFESSEGGDVNHVSIVDCSQEFYILSLDPNKGKPEIGNNYALASVVNDQGNKSSSGISNGVYDGYTGQYKDEKDSGMGKTDAESANDTCSTDHELTGSDKIRSNEPLRGPNFSGQGSASYSSENSLEGKRQMLSHEKYRDMSNIQQYQSEKINQQPIPEASPYSEIDNNNNDGKTGANGAVYDEHCHYASTEIVSTPTQPPKNVFKPKPSPPEVNSKPVSKLPAAKPGADLLPEMHPSEKKESIKRWIKSGLPTTLPPPPTSSVTNMSNRPSSFKPGLTARSPMENKHLIETDEVTKNTSRDHLISNTPNLKTFSNSKQEKLNNNQIGKEDKEVTTEEKGTQIESDAASLMSCESCPTCCKSLKTTDDKGLQHLETFQPYQMHLGRPILIPGVIENKRTPNLPIPVKIPVVPNLSSNNTASNNNKHVNKNTREEKENIYSTIGPTTTMYTTKANLEHTIKLQQEMLRQAMVQQQKIKPVKSQARGFESNSHNINGTNTSHQESSPASYYHRPNMVHPASHINTRPTIVSVNSPTNPSRYFRHLGKMVNSPSLSKFKDKVTGNNIILGPSNIGYKNDTNRNGKEIKIDDQLNCNPNNVNMEWKVKKRPDGTRYITRKPIRNKILKERAQIINQERLGLTTDDDAMSELKVGRYWNKDERKKHSERAKDRKRKEMLLRQIKMCAVREHSEEREPRVSKFIEHTSHHGGGGGGGAGSSGGNHSSSGSSGSNAKNRAIRETIKGCVIKGNVLTDKPTHGLVKQSTSIVTQSHGHGVKLNGPINRAPSKNQINELLTVTTV
uniref:PDZ domain-containing protein n=2 Tax=Tetranychus urticae TaxID=32264 RepID=T1KVG8_TETUR